MELSQRQTAIFRIVVEGHISTGEPIGSEWVAGQLQERVSSATVRAELLELERVGLLRQPHTSAGRVPTEEGYRVYIELFVQKNAPASDDHVFDQDYLVDESHTPEEKVRRIARELSDVAGNIVMVGANPRSLYAVGMGQMFSAPEASNLSVMRHISEALDGADDLMDELYEIAAGGEVKILIGKQNPIDENLSLMVTKYETSEGERLMVLLGFMRMRYERNIALMQAMKRFLESEL
ncbi:MAG: hypothetical protein NT003_04265 [Candidatus Magasanikbacteria bacterium]|nr:hypothetical protein [Candidatus Magasanikbacteria bacterium]